MEPILGFKESAAAEDVDVGVDQSLGGGYKLVPWLSWNEWDTVGESLFSSSQDSISSALRRVMAWRSRGCLPVAVDVTASLIEIQQKDPYFRVDICKNDIPESEEMLSMLYCMAIMRLVNGVVEKTRKKTEISIAEAANAINIPRVLIDIRHEGSHRDLPSLRLVRLASIKALDWLKSYYWEPQKKAMQCQNDVAARIRKEINSRLCELTFCLNIKLVNGSSSPAKRKWMNPCESFCGRNKFLSLIAWKMESSKLTGSKKQMGRVLKNLVRLYSSHSSEVVTVLVELLLNGSGSSYCSFVDDHTQSIFDDWKPAVMKLCNKLPELILILINTVLKKIETEEATKCGSVGELASSENADGPSNINRLSALFAWLVRILSSLKPIRTIESSGGVKEGSSTNGSLAKSTLIELLRKSLLVTCPVNNQLKSAALALASMIGNESLVEKLNNLFSLSALDPEFDEEDASSMSFESIFDQHEDSILRVAKKLEIFKHSRLKNNATDNVSRTDEKRWVVTKKWNKCPIGMLPHGVGCSGCLPVLDCVEVHEQILKQNSMDEKNLKRKPDCGIEFSSVKKAREDENPNQKDEEDETFSQGVQGKLLISGAWKKVDEQGLLAIAGGVRILV